LDSRTSDEWVPQGIKVNAGTTGELRGTALTKQGRTPAHLRFYAEGGNLIVGEDAKENTVVLVGKDAIAATKAEYSFTEDDDVRRLIAGDFGLESLYQVICVEQPGKFHLDMGLLFVGKGRVVVNDSEKNLKAAQVEAGKMPHDPSLAKLVAKLELQCRLEDQAESDLIKADMIVRREKLEDEVNYNFFNGEFVMAENGQIYYLTNGTTQEMTENAFRDLLVKELGVVTGVLFSPAGAAQESLREQGGVGCRIKGAPAKKTTNA
jgi:hypothetical protein